MSGLVIDTLLTERPDQLKVTVGIIVGHPADPEVADRASAADFVLAATTDVEQFLTTLAR
jgi:hypothetical protein